MAVLTFSGSHAAAKDRWVNSSSLVFDEYKGSCEDILYSEQAITIDSDPDAQDLDEKTTILHWHSTVLAPVFAQFRRNIVPSSDEMQVEQIFTRHLYRLTLGLSGAERHSLLRDLNRFTFNFGVPGARQSACSNDRWIKVHRRHKRQILGLIFLVHEATHLVHRFTPSRTSDLLDVERLAFTNEQAFIVEVFNTLGSNGLTKILEDLLGLNAVEKDAFLDFFEYMAQTRSLHQSVLQLRPEQRQILIYVLSGGKDSTLLAVTAQLTPLIQAIENDPNGYVSIRLKAEAQERRAHPTPGPVIARAVEAVESLSILMVALIGKWLTIGF
ncbi:MAG: hypothetical protein AB7N80_00230 [Bdellovibrionales bacterium]